jgi:hypothetical protein
VSGATLNCGRWWKKQVEAPKQVVILGHGTLTFEDLDGHGRLVIGKRGEGLLLLAGDGSVSLD